VIHIGLTAAQLEALGKAGLAVHKTSRRDIAYVTSKGLNGATTVSGTMVLAHMAGIPVFATGGIGGVHRGVENSMDISADLTELGRTPVAVVCAGAKSILDIPRTLEYLETHGVSVVGFRTSAFPGFFAPSSGSKAPFRLDTADECAAMIESNLQLGLQSGMVIGVPVPEDEAKYGKLIEAATEQALAAASVQGISGKDITPFLLDYIERHTEGKSLDTNIALVKNNAAVAADIAVRLAHLRKGSKAEL